MKDKNSFIGLGFGKKVPIDIICLFLAGIEAKTYTILVVDEFQRINNVSESLIKSGLGEIQYALSKLKKIYNFNPEVLLTSDFMHTEEYNSLLIETTEKCEILNENDRHKEYVRYVLNEIACTEFLRIKGAEVKLGPSKEKEYDTLMREIGLNIEFAYVIDAYALGTKELCSVVHYVPEHRGINGQRVMIDDSVSSIESKLIIGPDDASNYFLKMASASGRVLGGKYFQEDEINRLKGNKLRKITRDLVIENIIKPYSEVRL